MEFRDSLEEFVTKENAKFKYDFGDRIPVINFDAKPIIAYDYLFIENGNEHSFHNEEFNNISSEEYPNKSDYAIYFEKIKLLCCRTLEETFDQKYTEHIHIINNPNKQIKELLKKISGRPIVNENCPPIMQFGLYTNKKDSKAPRIFCFIGNYATIYILFYDPYHKILPSKY